MKQAALSHILTGLGAALVLGISTATSAPSIVPSYLDAAGEGFNDPTATTSPITGNPSTLGADRKAAFEYALGVWAAHLDLAVDIIVEAEFNSLGGSGSSAPLGAAGPKVFDRDFTNAPRTGTWYAIAEANQIFGTDDYPEGADIVAEFNSDVDGNVVLGSVHWYYGIDGNPPGFDIDFVTTVLHELCHGLGFLTIVGEDGTWTAGYPDVFGIQLRNTATGKNFVNMNDSERAAAQISGSLYWKGPAVEAKKGGMVKMYAPNPYEKGSSTSPWDTSLTPNLLMEPFATDTFTDITLEKEAFMDIDWPLAAQCEEFVSTDVPKAIDYILTYPNPTVSTLVISGEPQTVKDLNVKLSIAYPFDYDLTAALRSPAGTQILLFDAVGGFGHNFTNTVLDDEADLSIGSGSAPFTGCFRPQTPLSAFNGQSALGTWRLFIQTADFETTGSLTGWSLQFNCVCEGEGEGEGEGEDPCTLGECPDFDGEGAQLYTTLSANWETSDRDGTGIRDSWEVAVLEQVMCRGGLASRRNAICVFRANLEVLRAEAGYAAIDDVENVVAALLSISTQMQEEIMTSLGLSGTYQVIGGTAKLLGEPFSPQGDPDADGFLNLIEYGNTLGASLAQEDYVAAVLNPLLDGGKPASELPAAGNAWLLILITLLSSFGLIGALRRTPGRIPN